MTGLQEQAKKHAPGVDVTDTQVIINVGHEIEHPMLDAHLIETIDVLQFTKAGLLRVKTFSLIAWEKPEVTIELADLKPGTYKVQARCNLHGTFENDFVI